MTHLPWARMTNAEKVERDYFDTHWLGMLMDAAGVSLGGRKLGDLNQFMKRSGLTPKFDEPPRHRAEADARRLASTLCSRAKP